MIIQEAMRRSYQQPLIIFFYYLCHTPDSKIDCMKLNPKSVSYKDRAKSESKLQDIRGVDERLKQLHRLKTEVEELDIIKVPHKVAPTRREVIQLMDVNSQLVKKNARNDLKASMKSISNLVNLFSKEGKSSGEIRLDQLRDCLNASFPEVSGSHQVEIINNHQGEMIRKQEIFQFLTHNECTDHDPVKAAFEKLDPDNQGFLSYQAVLGMMNLSGTDLLSEESMAKLLCVDKFDQIDQKAFRKIISKFQSL